MKGNTNGNSTDASASGTEEVFIPEIEVIEREASAYLTGFTEQKTRQCSDELGLPFASLAARVSHSLAFQGKRASMPMLQMRSASARTSGVLQPEMALARRPYRLMQGSGAAERAGSRDTTTTDEKIASGVLRAPRQPLTPEMLKDIRKRFKRGVTTNEVARAYGFNWAKANHIREQLMSGRRIKSITANAAAKQMAVAERQLNRPLYPLKPKRSGKQYKLTPAERRKLGRAVEKALEKGTPISTVAKKHGFSWFTARACYQEVTGKKLPRTQQSHTQRKARTSRGVRTQPAPVLVKAAAASA